MIKGIIFDIDGVLIDTENTHFLAFRKVLETYHYDLPYEQYKQHFSGRSIKGALLSFLQEEPLVSDGQVSDFIDEVTKRKIAATIEIFRKNIVFFEDTLQFIQSIKDGNITLKDIGEIQEKPKLALTTGLESVLIEEVLKQHNLNELFPIIVTPGQYKKSKPDPESYLQTLENMNCTAEETIGIEDSPSGVQALNEAGIFSIAITNTFSHDELEQSKSIVDSLITLLPENKN
ncbi:MAG TPA: HAD family phosphatase [Candidatus Saccharimonadales bacterium]|nr:HAD family phosphatase [Candidatus Saccharimonadales bacterium]